MQINMSGHHVEITAAMRDYANEKFERLGKHINDIINLDIIMSVEKVYHKAKGNLYIRGATLHAEAEAEDMYAAIDGLVDKLRAQAIKYKEKKNNTHKGDGEDIIH